MIWNIKKIQTCYRYGISGPIHTTQDIEVRCLFRELGVLGNFTPAELWGYNPALLVIIWCLKISHVFNVAIPLKGTVQNFLIQVS